jgi:DNA-binding CsgD family transcriptional regulator/tetratricopeptide (TPR) repeat protein
MVAAEERQRIGRTALSFADALPISARPLPKAGFRVPDSGAILTRMDPRARGPLVGRAAELETLERALDEARSGQGAAFLIAGEAGIGKTRLTSEIAGRASEGGFEAFVGRSIDFVGTELPYQPFVEALRPLGDLRHVLGRKARSQLNVFEETLALLSERAAAAPVLLLLEDLHWADASSLDLVVYLAHNVDNHPVLLLGSYRADDPASAERMRRLAEGVRRSGSGGVLELGPLQDGELEVLVAAHSESPPPAELTGTIVSRSEGNPFFAEELLAAGQSGELPRALRDLLLQRVERLDPPTQNLMRIAAAAGRDVAYPLLAAVAVLPERDVRESLRRAVEQGVLVADQTGGAFRFRHALLAEAVYATILPGEREDLHAGLAQELSRSGATAAELALHWAAAGDVPEALIASVEAARQTEAVFGLAEALAHLERALTLWPAVPEAAEIAGLNLVELCARAARLASQVGASTRAVELARHAIELVGMGDLHRAAILHVDLAEYLYETGSNDSAFTELERAVEIAPAEPPSPERAYALASLAAGLMLAWRHQESLAASEEALALARAVGAGEAEIRALTARGVDLAYIGRAEEGVAELSHALQRAEDIGDHWGLDRAYINFTDVLTMLGRPRESARLGQVGLAAMRRYGIYSPVLVSNRIEALHATGDWDEAERLSAAALRRVASSYPYALYIVRALVEMDRGDFDAARAHFEVADITLRGDRGLGLYDGWLADLALWEHRWTDADTAIEKALACARPREAAQIRVQVCAKGLRAQAELAALARARRDADAMRSWLTRARKLVALARDAAAEAGAVTPTAAGWLALAEAEYQRAGGATRPERWAEAAGAWDRLERPPYAAYCRWREAEALVAAGASRTDASTPLREAHAVAARIGAKPLLRELELLAQRARLDLATPEEAVPEGHGLEELGLTRREAEVLTLVARGYTNREIAGKLVISEKTASAHVSHILRKLGAPNRREAAAIAHRVAVPTVGQP